MQGEWCAVFRPIMSSNDVGLGSDTQQGYVDYVDSTQGDWKLFKIHTAQNAVYAEYEAVCALGYEKHSNRR
jgi:hypothetical protein